MLLISSINHFINVFCWSLIGFPCICSQPKILNYDIHIKPYFYFKIELYTASFFFILHSVKEVLCLPADECLLWSVYLAWQIWKEELPFLSRSLKILAREPRFLFLCLFLYIVKLSWTEHKKEFFVGFKLTSTDNKTICTMKFVYLFCKGDKLKAAFHS